MTKASIRMFPRFRIYVLKEEILHHALNSLATHALDFLRVQLSVEWFERYGVSFEQYPLPKHNAQRQRLVTIGNDGQQLFE